MSLRIIQITDCHLMSDPTAEIKGICTRARFDAVVDAVAAELPHADLLVVTGDLTHDEQLESYVALRDALAAWSPKLRVIPGNHDDRMLMRQTLRERIRVEVDRNVFVEQLGRWSLIGLDSHRPGAVDGELGPLQLAWLEHELDQAPDRFTLLFVHHPPVLVGSSWLDTIALVDAEPLWQLLKQHSQVRAVSAGHVHQESTSVRDSVTVLTTPSTGVQFLPETETLVVDSASPGYRVLELHDSGMLRTWVVRVRPPLRTALA